MKKSWLVFKQRHHRSSAEAGLGFPDSRPDPDPPSCPRGCGVRLPRPHGSASVPGHGLSKTASGHWSLSHASPLTFLRGPPSSRSPGFRGAACFREQTQHSPHTLAPAEVPGPGALGGDSCPCACTKVGAPRAKRLPQVA